MKILVACEESQAVCIAFRNKGHEAYSCDVQECSGDHPEWHIKGDAIKEAYSGKYDMMIAFPPCTHLAVSGAAWFKIKREDGRQQQGIDFFMKIINAPINKIAVENPVGIMNTIYRKPNQILYPYEFGENSTKKTCLWLKNLPPLMATKIITPEKHTTKSGKIYDKWWFDTCLISDLKERASIRSKTFPGIALAMSNQWSDI